MVSVPHRAPLRGSKLDVTKILDARVANFNNISPNDDMDTALINTVVIVVGAGIVAEGQHFGGFEVEEYGELLVRASSVEFDVRASLHLRSVSHREGIGGS